jgi:hypothetical protein
MNNCITERASYSTETNYNYLNLNKYWVPTSQSAYELQLATRSLKESRFTIHKTSIATSTGNARFSDAYIY